MKKITSIRRHQILKTIILTITTIHNHILKTTTAYSENIAMNILCTHQALPLKCPSPICFSEGIPILQRDTPVVNPQVMREREGTDSVTEGGQGQNRGWGAMMMIWMMRE